MTVGLTFAGNDSKGKVGKGAYLEKWVTNSSGLTPGDLEFEVNFEWNDEEFGVPGAITVKNEHESQFHLKTVTLLDIPVHGSNVHFICNSWVYPAHRYQTDRLFFTNQAYLPDQTPAPLRKYREEELEILRGNGEGELKEWDRVYDYAYYNDLGDPDKGEKYVRPVLGGSSEYPYPRRGRTGRSPTKTDPNTESRLPIVEVLEAYIPRDERFRHLKLSDSLGYGLKAISEVLVGELHSLFDKTPSELDSFEDELNLYEGGIKLPGSFIEKIREHIPFEILKAFLQVDDAPIRALGEIYRVVELLGLSFKLYKAWLLCIVSDSSLLTDLLNECRALWSSSGLEEALQNLSDDTDFGCAQSAKALLASIKTIREFDVLTMRDCVFGQPKCLCSLSRLPQELLPELTTVMWNGEHYFLGLVNLWVNLISSEPPQ